MSHFMKNSNDWDKVVASEKAYVTEALDKAAKYEGDSPSYKEFYNLILTIFNHEDNPFGFLQDGSYLGSWQGAAALVSMLHHSCVDDGGHCFISCRTHGPKLVFSHWSDIYAEGKDSKQLLYRKVEPGLCELMDSLAEMRGRRGIKPSEQSWEMHDDYERFITELKAYPEESKARQKAFEDKGKRLKALRDGK